MSRGGASDDEFPSYSGVFIRLCDTKVTGYPCDIGPVNVSLEATHEL